MRSKRHLVQFLALALAAGAILGRFTPWVAGIVLVGIGLAAAFRWRVAAGLALALAVGLLRGGVVGSEPAKAPTFLEPVRARIERAIDRSLPSADAALLNGILLGARSDLSPQLRADFRATGTTHIVAVSGYNVTVVVAFIAAFLTALPLGQSLRTLASVFGILGFVILTGASPSVVRAGIMGGLTVLARAVGRPGDAGHALVLTSCGMLLADPALATSLSFQLSVAATAGLVCLARPLEERLAFLPATLGLRGSLATTVAAIIMTEPILVLAFGRSSMIAPIANLLILPLVPPAMLLGAVVAAVVAAVPAAAPLVGWIAWVPLAAIRNVAHAFARLPFAVIELGGSAAFMTAAGAAALAAMLVVRWRGRHAPA